MRPVIGITADVEDKYLKINQQYARALEDAGACPLVLAPSAHVIDLASIIDGLLIPGGDDLHPSYYNEEVIATRSRAVYEMKIVNKVRSDFEFSIIREIIKLRRPVLGICYGIQLINVVFGGSLYQDIRSQMPAAMDHKKDHVIKVEENKIISSGRFNVNSSHHQAVKALGEGLKAIAFSGDNVIEAICSESYPFLLGVQWHPERIQDSLSKKIFRSFVEASSRKDKERASVS